MKSNYINSPLSYFKNKYKNVFALILLLTCFCTTNGQTITNGNFEANGPGLALAPTGWTQVLGSTDIGNIATYAYTNSP